MKVDVTEAWRTAHPGACIGLLELSGVDNTRAAVSLDDQKRETEARVRAQYAGLTRPDFSALPVMSAYVRYYKRFGKTYHVQLQLESIVLRASGSPTSRRWSTPTSWRKSTPWCSPPGTTWRGSTDPSPSTCRAPGTRSFR